MRKIFTEKVSSTVNAFRVNAPDNYKFSIAFTTKTLPHLSRLVNRNEENKTGMSNVGAIPTAQKAQVFKICPGSFYEKLTKNFQNPQRVPFVL